MSDDEIERIVAACRLLPDPQGDYLEDDFLVNLVATVIDFQTHTTAVVRAIDHFREEVLPGLYDLDDLIELMARFPITQDGNTELARHLWGYRMWTRAQMLRDLVAYFSSIGVTDQEELRAWAETTTFEDFEGKVRGLGRAVYQWLVMRVGVETVKPDVHVLRFVETAVGRPLGDVDAVHAVTEAARRLGRSVLQVDWAIWEAGRNGLAEATRPAPARTTEHLPRQTTGHQLEEGAQHDAATIATQDGEVVSFVSDESGYLTWIAAHPRGFVVNSERRPKPNYLVLHRATCRTISGRPARGRTFTDPFRKTCAADLGSIVAWAEAVGSVTPCRLCAPS